MDMETLKMFFLWCSLIDGGLLLLWTIFLGFTPDFVYRIQNYFFPLPRETFNTLIYAFLGLFKLFFLMFNVVPYLALVIIT